MSTGKQDSRKSKKEMKEIKKAADARKNALGISVSGFVDRNI